MSTLKQIIQTPTSSEFQFFQISRDTSRNQTAEFEEIIVSRRKKRLDFEQKIRQLKNAMNDKLFLRDLRNISKDFEVIDVEEWEEGAISIELQEGLPILRASPAVQERIEMLLHKQQEGTLSEREQKELESYEEIDDYLSFLNRITRNLYVEAGNN